MNVPASVWRMLEIERTDDVVAIRRAYARRLKQTDVEADPAAFIALREALERALDYAASSPSSSSDGPEADLLSGESRAPAPPPAGDLTAPELACGDVEGAIRAALGGPPPSHFRLPPDSAPAGGGEATIVPAPDGELAPTAPDLPLAHPPADRVAAFEGGAAVDEHMLRDLRFRELGELLFGEEAPPKSRVRQAAAAILDDPQMTNLKYAAEVEAWMVEAICASSPRSDPVIAEAVPHFGWDADYGKLGQPHQVAAIVERWRALMFLHYVSQPRHEYHVAWRELTRPDDSRYIWNRWLIEGKVRSLLTVIREKYPSAESGLDAYRVGLWDEYFNPNAYPGDDYEGLGWGAIFLIVFPPAAAGIAFFNHNSRAFRIGVSAWAVAWTIWAILA